MRNLRGTINVALSYEVDGKVDMIGYVDADHAGNHATQRSMTSYIFALNGTAATWTSQRQEVVTLSTCEVEYVAMTEGANEALWLWIFLRIGFRRKTDAHLLRQSRC